MIELKMFYMELSMGKAVNKKIYVLLLFVLSNISTVLGNITDSQNIVSLINGKYIKSYNENYSILIAGHIYGSHNQSVFPSASILGRLYEINKMDCSFFVSLGDNFRFPNDIHINNYKKSFANQLNFPIFNAVGNHDVIDRQKYVENFGKTYYDFIYGSELYIFLDTELDQNKITGDQLSFFNTVTKQKAMNSNIKNVFIFSHKLIWASNISTYQTVNRHANESLDHEYDEIFHDIILPNLIDLAKNKNVFWISGDIGCSWSLPLFYDKDKNTGISFIATGIGDTEKDLIVKVEIKDGTVKFFPVSLTGEELNKIEHYSVKYWLKYFHDDSHDDSFIMRYYCKINRMLLHKYYWMGVFTIFPIALLFYLFRKQ